MSEYKLQLISRSETGKKAKNLRSAGKIPSVISVRGKEPILTASDYVPTEKVLAAAGYHSTIDLDIDGKKQLAIVKNVALDPVTRRIVNIEFQGVSASEIVEATAPIVIVNFETSDASKLHHFEYTQALEEIDVKAKPADLPSELELDASGLTDADSKLTISDLKLPKGVELVDKEIDPEQVIISVYDPAAEAAAREAESKTPEAATEPAEAAAEAKEA